MTEQAYNDLRAQLQKHKDNQRLYRDKLKEVNFTRTHIKEQLQLLTQNYDKKIKALEQKLENLKNQNHTLAKQNVIFKTEIDTYQARLVEKEKIIALLLQQRKDINAVNSSQRSKSDQTESLKAVEEEKNMKKQDKYQEQPQIKKIELEQKTNEVDRKENVPEIKKYQEEERELEREEKKAAPPPPPRKKKEGEVAKQEQKEPVEQIQQVEKEKQLSPVPQRKVPPPPPHKNKNPKQVPHQKKHPHPHHHYKHHEPQQDEVEQEAQDSQLLMSYFSSPSHHLNQSREHEQKHARNPFGPVDDNQVTQQPEATPEEAVETIEEYPEVQPVVSEIEDPYQQRQEQYNEEYHQEEVVYNEEQNYLQQVHYHQQEQVREEVAAPAQSNDFLSHFQANNDEHLFQLVKPIAKKSKPKKVAKNRYQTTVYPEIEQPQANSTDFFTQLGNKPEETHPLDIEESSIDHMDRDSSLISNQHPYFVEENVEQRQEERPRPKSVKMTKKKGKRDQIKVADPSLFE